MSICPFIIVLLLSFPVWYRPYTGWLDPSTQQHRTFPGLRTLVCLERYLWLFSNHIVVCFLLFVLFLSNNQQLVYWPFTGPLLVCWAFTDLEFYRVELTHWRGLKLPTWASWNLIHHRGFVSGGLCSVEVSLCAHGLKGGCYGKPEWSGLGGYFAIRDIIYTKCCIRLVVLTAPPTFLSCWHQAIEVE